MQVTAKVTWEGGWKLVRIHRVHICLDLDQIEFTFKKSIHSWILVGNDLEVRFPPEIFEVFLWFRDQLVQIGCHMLWAETFFS